MNTELLLNIKANILAEPDAFRMDVWSCGTAHCIAGWAVKLSGLAIDDLSVAVPLQTVHGVSVQDTAAQLLGLDDAEAGNLFNVGCWPESLAERYDEINDGVPSARQQRAAVAAEVIDKAITGGIRDWEDDD